MLEVFTVGGGEYLVNIFNAVAAWSGGGGYRSLIRVVMVMGLIYSLLVVAFTLNYKAWLNWFLQATAIYLCLMVPTVDIKVTDRINPGLTPSTVDNVPMGLGVLASFTRSEEHTSELQSLMRISYAVFCLKKKKKPEHNTN